MKRPLTVVSGASGSSRTGLIGAIAAACMVTVLMADAGAAPEGYSPEGFSISSEGLPDLAVNAWYATVLIEGRRIILRMGQSPQRYVKRGSGIIMSLDEERRRAMIATNAHIITCYGETCGLRVGFGDPLSSERPTWSDSVQVVSRDCARDLAFVEVEIPEGVRVRAARFVSAETDGPAGERVVSIGWPDLTIRKEWGVPPPPNCTDYVKRHSGGIFLRGVDHYQMRPAVGETLEGMHVIFHNADVLPGSSGGPLVNRFGDVIGINTMVVSESPDPDHLRFCARRDPQVPGTCVHVAIASNEVIDEYARIFGSRMTAGRF